LFVLKKELEASGSPWGTNKVWNGFLKATFVSPAFTKAPERNSSVEFDSSHFQRRLHMQVLWNKTFKSQKIYIHHQIRQHHGHRHRDTLFLVSRMLRINNGVQLVRLWREVRRVQLGLHSLRTRDIRILAVLHERGYLEQRNCSKICIQSLWRMLWFISLSINHRLFPNWFFFHLIFTNPPNMFATIGEGTHFVLNFKNFWIAMNALMNQFHVVLLNACSP